ncbi:thiol:disulfide interchange protein DsbA/DsbL [Kitasatospora sp. NPDC057015]|uniref:thiol:disulfide interchange protein DsbA/DsbL n=1 Tax=Kitasatospora sp. NPDC057015 TaxID=3346001 RepID=UPI00363B3052
MKSLLRSAVLLTVATGLAACPVQAGAATHQPAAEGHPYVQLAHPQPVREAARVEAVEFFSYDCVHSQQLEQPLQDWARRHQADVALRRVPAVWPGSPGEQGQQGLARLYYALDGLGEVERLQSAVYRSVRESREDLRSEEAATAWAVRQGVDEGAFRSAYRSAGTDRQVSEAAELLRRYEIDELPSVVVQGRYRTSPTAAGGVREMPAVLDRLVEQG